MAQDLEARIHIFPILTATPWQTNLEAHIHVTPSLTSAIHETDMAARIIIKPEVTAKISQWHFEARIHIRPQAVVKWELCWDSGGAFWDIHPWRRWGWTERFRPTFASRFRVVVADWLHWDTSRRFWDFHRWDLLWLKLHPIANSWKLHNGRLDFEINLKLADSELPPKLRPRWTVKSSLSYEIYKPYKPERYTTLPTWEHRRPKFLAVLEHIITPLVEMENQAFTLATRDYNVNTAVGVELDRIGEWVGVSREVYPPLGGVYFTWDGAKSNGWGMGIWRGEDDPPTGLSWLPDYAYRMLIKAKIAANRWDGTIESAYRAWSMAFDGENRIVIIDNQDMSMDIILITEEDDTILRAILRDEKLPLRPTGVKVNYDLLVAGQYAAFMWDVIGGEPLSAGSWDVGQFI
ncbi:hypothetical protein FACS1894187_24060 [Synergistales bacterium]|nr:hypothetical protein FACS1894187_24060 [Synergistales bacterium]